MAIRRRAFPQSLRGRYLIVLLALAVIPVLIVGALAYDRARSALIERLEFQLTSVADLKKQQITNWFDARRADVELLADNFLNEEHFTVIMNPDSDPDRREAFARFITQNLHSVVENRDGYVEIAFVDTSGQVVLSTIEENVGTSYRDRPIVRKTFESDDGSYVRGIHRAPEGGRMEMAFGHVMHRVDLETDEVLPEVNGAVIVRIRMDETIYPLIRAWPGMGRTGETLIARAEGEETLFLNPTRFNEEAALSLRLPANADDAVAAHRSARGQSGVLRSTDYRGVMVLAAYRHIPQLDWGFVSKEDLSEVFAPIRDLTLQWVLVTIVVLLAAVMIAIVLANRMTGSLARLASAAGRVEAGDLDTEIQVNGDDEVAQLGRSFNAMVASVRSSQTQLEYQRDELQALFSLSQTLLGTVDASTSLETALHQALLGTDTDAGAILLLDREDQKLVVRTSMGLPDELSGQRFPMDATTAPGLAVLRREPVGSGDITTEHEFRVPPKVEEAGIRSNLAVPMLIDGQAIGAMVLDSFTPRAFGDEVTDVAQAIANQTAVALERARLFDDVNESYDRTLDSLVAALDTRDNETQGHSQRVVAYTMALARAMDLRSEELHTIRRGALLHDIGKIGVPDAILHKPAPLTDEEWKTMRCHPQWGADILQGIPFLEPAVRILLAHHERWDGGGYPRGLAGEEIPLGARLFAVADAFDAMTSDRPYRAARSYEWARDEIVAGRGTQFDPAVVDAFLAIPKREWMLHASEAPGATSTAPSGLASAAFDRVSITRLASITQSLRSVSKSLDLEEVLDQTAQAAVDELGAAGSAVFVFDAESNTVSVGARKYFPEQLARHYKRVLAEGYPHSGTVREDGMQRLPDAQDGDRAEVNVEQAAATEKYGEYVCVPLHADDEVKGVLCALSPAAERFREDTIRMLEFIGLHAGAALDNASRHESMKHQAITDGLTGAYNRRYFDEFLSHEVRRCARYHHGVSILMLDIDTFKGYNDSAGHAAGDEVLRSAVELFRHQLRLVDLIARYGGEEFAMVLPETGPEGARQAAERVRNAFEEHFAENTGLTISVGVSHCICGSDELTAQGLIERADRALYAAKRSGKNRVVLVDE